MKSATATVAATAPPAADRLAAYAAGLDYAHLRAPIVAAAKTCLIDAAACAIFGAGLPWSRAIADMIAASGTTGPCAVPGFDHRLDPRQAALALGAFAHAFELDSLRKPGAGAHPGATVALPAFAMAQATGRSGRDLVAAIVAGCEVSFRVGAATLHTPELEGFHAPGIVGPFGAASRSAPQDRECRRHECSRRQMKRDRRDRAMPRPRARTARCIDRA
jgi:2-methylcitrate dehydratase PrpD